MKKIPTIFQRNYLTDHLVRDEWTKGCEWVRNGDGYATGKFDGTAVLVSNGELWLRKTWQNAKRKPVGFVACDKSDHKGTVPGWVPASDDREGELVRQAAFNVNGGGKLEDGTYELIGPEVLPQHFNPHRLSRVWLERHGQALVLSFPRTFEEIGVALANLPYEGVVFWHEDGRAAKVKRTDYALPWPCVVEQHA